MGEKPVVSNTRGGTVVRRRPACTLRMPVQLEFTAPPCGEHLGGRQGRNDNVLLTRVRQQRKSMNQTRSA